MKFTFVACEANPSPTKVEQFLNDIRIQRNFKSDICSDGKLFLDSLKINGSFKSEN